MHTFTQAFLTSRHYDSAFFTFLEDPFQIGLETEDACAFLHASKDQVITILPDFDMDGICSGVLTYAGLSLLGFKVHLYAPHASEGYGFDEGTIQDLMDVYPDTQVLYTCDVGATAYEGIRYAKEILGLEVLVTDHHHLGEETLPCLMVNPHLSAKRQGTPLPSDENRCGAFVTFQLLKDYAKTYEEESTRVLLSYLHVFAAMGTISDSMPLYHENRWIVKSGLTFLRWLWDQGGFPYDGPLPYMKAFQGLFTTLSYLYEQETFQTVRDLNEDLIGYYLAPMFNSIKRMGESSSLAFDLFFGDDAQRSISILYDLNQTRKRWVERYEQDLLEDPYQRYAPYVYFSEAPPGFLGLLAGRLRQDGPCLVLNALPDGSFKGSGRAPEDYPFLTRTQHLSMFRAGHEAAFGVGFQNSSELRTYLQFLDQDLKAYHAFLEEVSKGQTPYDLSFEASLTSLSDFKTFSSELSSLGPFGQGLPRPVFEFTFPLTSCDVAFLSEGESLKFTLSNGLPILCFRQREAYDQLLEEGVSSLNVLGGFHYNTWMGSTELQVIGDLFEG